MRQITAPLLNQVIGSNSFTPKIPVYSNGILLENLANNYLYDITAHDSQNWHIDTSIPYNPNAFSQMHYLNYKNRTYFNNIVIAKIGNSNGYVDGAWGPIDLTKIPTNPSNRTWKAILDLRYEYIPAYGGNKEYILWRPENSSNDDYDRPDRWRPTICSLYRSARIRRYLGWFNDVWNPHAIFSYYWSNGRFIFGIPNDPVHNGIYIWSSPTQKISLIVHLIQGQSAYNKYQSMVTPISGGG